MSAKGPTSRLRTLVPASGAGKLLTVLAGLLISQAFAALAQIVLARRVDALDYGRYLACVSLVTVLVSLVSLGLDQWLLVNTSATAEGLARSFYSALRLRVPLIVGWLLGLALLSVPLAKTTFPPAYLLLAAVSVSSDSTSLLAYSALRNRGQHWRVTLLQTVAAGLLLASAFVLPLAPGRAGLFLAAKAAISLALALFSVLSVRRVIGGPAGDFAPVPAILRGTLPFMLSELAVAVYMRADLTILSLSQGVVAASVYGPATSLLSMCFLVPNAIYLLVLPPLARLFRTYQERYGRLSRVQLAAQGVSGSLLFAGVLALAPWLIQLVLGPTYAASAGVLRLLSPILLVKSLSFGTGAMLTSQGQQSMRTRAQVGAAVFNVVANLLVVGRYGVTGVAIVYVLSEIGLCVAYGAALFRGRRAGRVYADETLSA